MFLESSQELATKTIYAVLQNPHDNKWSCQMVLCATIVPILTPLRRPSGIGSLTTLNITLIERDGSFSK